MPFSDSRLRRRIQRLEHEARHWPRLHALRLTLYILIGYFWPLVLAGACAIAAAVVLSVFLLAWDEAGVHGLIAWLVLLCAVPVGLYAVIAAVFPKPPLLPGQQLTPQEAPELFAMIEQVRAASGAPPLQQVNLDHQTNARMVQRPGIGGRNRYCLVLGVPLLAALTPEHLKAVLAHEFGHATGRGNSFHAWVNRVVRTWNDLTQTEEAKPTIYGRLLGWFARWYVPWLLTGTLAIRRMHEYEADQASADVVGGEAAASALSALEWSGYRLGRTFQAALWHGVVQQELPPSDYMQRVMGFLAAEVERDWVSAWRVIELRRKGRVTDEHPSLIERLAAIGAAHVLQSPGEEYAAAGVPLRMLPECSALSLLGAGGEKAIRQTNAMWKAQVISTWRVQHKVAEDLAREAEEDNDPSPKAVAQRTWSRLQADLQYRDPIAARKVIAEYLALYPDHAEANFDMGRLLLAEDDDAGRTFLEKSMASDSDWTQGCLRVLLDYYRDSGRDVEADEIVTRIYEHQKAQKQQRRHVSRLGRSEHLRPHDLRPRKLRELWLAINRFPQVSRAYLAMRDTRVLKDKPVYVLAVTLGSSAGRMESRVVRAIAQSMPVPCTVLVLHWWKGRLRRRITEVCPTPVFEESRPA